ncbi:hypothetical protein B7693_03675 [Streptococcus mitis]|uniref:Uncharacterized protein n=1 Tax=Streptococcus mitis TaxID=28037 RepID=A0A1X1KWI6_STRMT|nr:hypothetical protein B7693_03675 [Streptococcus mitis]
MGKSPIDIINRDIHKEIIAKLEYNAPVCTDFGIQMKKHDFQKSYQIYCYKYIWCSHSNN